MGRVCYGPRCPVTPPLHVRLATPEDNRLSLEFVLHDGIWIRLFLSKLLTGLALS